jgi:hypothetical protein
LKVIRDRLGRDAGVLTSTSGQQSRVEQRPLFYIQRAAKAPFRPKRATDFRQSRGHFLRLPRRNCRAGLSAHDQAGRRLTRRELHDGAPQKLRRNRMAHQVTRAAWPPSNVWPITAPGVCDGTSAAGESRHRISGASVGQPTEPCLALYAETLPLVFASGIKGTAARANYSRISSASRGTRRLVPGAPLYRLCAIPLSTVRNYRIKTHVELPHQDARRI